SESESERDESTRARRAKNKGKQRQRAVEVDGIMYGETRRGTLPEEEEASTPRTQLINASQEENGEGNGSDEENEDGSSSTGRKRQRVNEEGESSIIKDEVNPQER